jgi:hypothetical protein
MFVALRKLVLIIYLINLMQMNDWFQIQYTHNIPAKDPLGLTHVIPVFPRELAPNVSNLLIKFFVDNKKRKIILIALYWI